MYWIYDEPTWVLGLITTLAFLLPSLLGLILGRKWVYRTFRLSAETNESVNGYFAGAGVLYGLLLGLVAVATWQNYDSANSVASKEASSIAALYRDVSAFPEPARDQLQDYLEQYLNFVIDVAWPAHRHGEVPRGGTLLLSRFQGVLCGFQPANVNQQVILAEALTAFNKLVEARRMRMDSVGTGLPGVFWVVILAGAVLSIALTYTFHLPTLRGHLMLTGIYSLFLGFMIFLVVALDNPFRGELSVTPESYVHVLNGLAELDPARQ
jgi:hypothetical protein